jgi:hypothetical protein
VNCSPDITPETLKAEKKSPPKYIEFSFPSPETTNITLAEITLAEAIKIAKNGFLGKQTNDAWWDQNFDVEADDKNTVWNKHIKNNLSILNEPVIRNMHLDDGKKFWVIYFSPKMKEGSSVKGGDAFVFIDRSNGKYLRFIGGE